MSLWSRIFRPERAKSDLDAEIEAHLALAAADKRDRGADPETARREAEREFGNRSAGERCSAPHVGMGLARFASARLTSALRQLRRTPRFSDHGDSNARASALERQPPCSRWSIRSCSGRCRLRIRNG